MNIMASPTIQTIHLSSAGRAAVLAQHLIPEQPIAVAIGCWVNDLVASAPLLDLTLNTRDVRTFLPAPIEELETVRAKSHPDELRGYGAMDPLTAQILEQWCAACGALIADVSALLWGAPSSPDRPVVSDWCFPEFLALTRYQRMALGATMQVATDELVTLAGLLCLAREPYGPLFTSSLGSTDIARCDTACTGLMSLYTWGHRWAAQQPADRRRDMVREHLRDANVALTLLFEAMHDQQQRQALSRLLIQLSKLRRQV